MQWAGDVLDSPITPILADLVEQDPPHRRRGGWRRLAAWRSCLLAHRQAEARQEQLALVWVRIGKKARYHAGRHRPQSLDDGAGFFQPSHMRVTRRESAISVGQAGKFVRRQGKQLRGLIETPTKEVSQAEVTHWPAFATPRSSSKASPLGTDVTIISGPGISSLLLIAASQRPLKSVKSPLGVKSDPGVPLREDMRGPLVFGGAACRRVFSSTQELLTPLTEPT